jgi:replicative DNA helicase Mcm
MTDAYAEIEKQLKRFFSKDTYVNKNASCKNIDPIRYFDNILELNLVYPDVKSLYIDFNHIKQFDKDLAESLLSNPDEWLDAAKEAVLETQLPVNNITDVDIRIIGLPDFYEVSISKLREIHVDRFLALRCVVSKVSEVRPDYEVAAFQCMRCGHVTRVVQSKDSDSLHEPFSGCENDTCGKKGPFKVIGRPESELYDHQYIKVQEPVENLRGSQPEFLNVSCDDEITGIVKPGDKVIITGVLKGKTRMMKEGKSKHLDFIFVANSIEKATTDYENIEVSTEELEIIKEMARNGTLKQNILSSVAPSIFGLEDVKLGIALQLFGGTAIELEDGTRKRGDIHILLVGDPGCGKSQLLDFVSKFAPRAVSFSGKSSTEAGLTGAAVKDEVDGKWWIQPGALTLADGGVCCADEVEKMKAGSLGSIHEALEQQVVHISKVVKADLCTRTAFLGAANPKFGRYDVYTPISEQIMHGDAFISRMDLLYILQDKPNKTTDIRLAKHILSTLRGKKGTSEPAMDLELFRKCIAYARMNVFPMLTDEAEELIISFFVTTREEAGKTTEAIPLTARTLEAAFRLATAHARMRLSNVVEKEDAREAVNLLLSNLRNVGIDPDTGALDVDIIECGTSRSQENKLKKITDIIKNLSDGELSKNKSANIQNIIEKCETENIGDPEGQIKKLKTRGIIFSPEEGYYKISTW